MGFTRLKKDEEKIRPKRSSEVIPTENGLKPKPEL